MNAIPPLELLTIFAFGVSIISWAWMHQHWNELKTIKERASIVVQFTTMGITVILLFFSVQANRNETIRLIQDNKHVKLCEYNQVIVNDIVELIATHTHQAQYQIGIPIECYADRSGDDFSPSPYYNSYEQYRITAAIINAKLNLVIADQSEKKYLVEYEKYRTALRFLERQCRGTAGYSEDTYRKARTNLSLSGSSVINELANLMRNCHSRQ